MNTYQVCLHGDKITQLNYYANNSKDAICMALSKEDVPANVKKVECKLVGSVALKTFRFTSERVDFQNLLYHEDVYVDIEATNMQGAFEKFELGPFDHLKSCEEHVKPVLNTFRFMYQGVNHVESVDVEAINIREALDKLDNYSNSHRESVLISCELVK